MICHNQVDNFEDKFYKLKKSPDLNKVCNVKALQKTLLKITETYAARREHYTFSIQSQDSYKIEMKSIFSSNQQIL